LLTSIRVAPFVAPTDEPAVAVHLSPALRSLLPTQPANQAADRPRTSTTAEGFPGVHAVAPTARSRSTGPGAVATEVGASHPVLGGALFGGRGATAGPAHLAAARDPVPSQVRGAAAHRRERGLPRGSVRRGVG
jgi:hypothetical protein